MKNIVRFSIFIWIYYLMTTIWVAEIKAQDWPCGNPAQNNISIPNNITNVYLSENSVAVHPLNPNIILSANNHHVLGKVSAYVSTDWGVTWNPQSNGIFDDNSWCDPAAGIDLNGYLYVSYLNGGGAMKVARSFDLGSTWYIATIPGGGSADKDHMHIDNSCTSDYEGRLYCAWDVSGTVKVSYSTNNGKDWSQQPTTLSSIGYGHGVNITTDNSGKVYIVWALHNIETGNWNQLQFTKSTDGGSNWNTPSTINLLYIANKNASGIGPSMTVNMQDNTIYLVYSGNTNSQDGYDVFMKKSTDGGTTWTESRVNQVQTGWQTFPWISCDPMTGYLACIYYDTRSGVKHTYLSISTNSGASWCDMKISTDPWQGTGTGIGNDYIGVHFNKGIVYPIWTDTRVGDNRYRTYTYPFEVILKDLIVQGAYDGNQLIQSANTITTSNVTINSGANVTFRTVNSITLLPGFYTNDNSYFSADLFHCEGYNKPENIAMNSEITKEEKDNIVPFEFSLSQNYPNPFNPNTSIKYSLKQDSWVTIIIYNILGQEVKRLVDRYEFAGYSSIVWDGTNNYGMQVSSGIYFYKLTAHEVSGSSTVDFTDQKKMVIIR